jgi:hypothetical protein
MSRTKSRTAILVTLLGAFSGIKGDLTEEEADYGLAIIENEYQGDLDAVKAALDADLNAGMRAVALAASLLG